ncbi:MAG: hypothetical protein U0324_24595 [Polyangiales bacterium]
MADEADDSVEAGDNDAQPVAFTKADCELFGKVPEKTMSDDLPPTIYAALQNLWGRLKRLAKNSAARHAKEMAWKPFCANWSGSGRPARKNLWSCIFPAEALNKSFGLQMAFIISPAGVELCFCMGAGRDQSKNQAKQLDALTRCRKALRKVPAATVAAVEKSLDAGWIRLREFMQPPTTAHDFDSLQAWLDHAASDGGAKASVSRFFSVEEVDALGGGIVDWFEEMVALFWPIVAAVYKNAGIAPPRKNLVVAPAPAPAPPPTSAPAVPTFAAVVAEAAAALSAAGLRFGDDAAHRARVRAFLASLAARRFVVLTGLSGSGKTQLARKVGQWLGRARVKVVPVRPDWTGPEALLGYEDALQAPVGGWRAWHVPPVLEFLLQARAEPRLPFVLVLDEMNLAHVERYFADLLSGMETSAGCLPDLAQGSDGLWRRVGATDRHPFPTNVFVVGTVNVDETTYQFSPKVLDRASTVEFRVATEALVSAKRIDDVKEAAPATRDAFLAITRDEAWHLAHAPPWAGDFADRVRGLHRLLARDRFEFGHRTYFEAQRLAALLAADGVALPEALDTFVLQKVLPRLHGGRRRLERCLDTLIWCCTTAPSDAAAKEALASPRALPPPVGVDPPMRRSREKVERMRSALLEHQFASFSE